MNLILITAVFATGLVGIGLAENSRINDITQTNALLRTKLAQYDKDVRPAGANDTGPVVVFMNIFIREIEKIDTDKHEWKTQMTCRIKWVDPRLSYKTPNSNFSYISVTSQEKIDQIWKPDIFIANERESHFHDLLSRNQYLRIFPDGGVLHNVRITTTLFCPMNLYLFPYELHKCSIRIASYAHTNADILFKWKEADAVQVSNNLGNLVSFSLRQNVEENCDSTTTTGTYSCLKSTFDFQRGSYLAWNHGQFPMVVAVFLGWMSFWLPVNSLPRIAIVLASFFYFQQTDLSFRENYSPKVSFETIYDKFACTSFFFVLCSVVEFIVMSYLSSRNVNQENSSRQANRGSELSATASGGVDEDMEKVTSRGNKVHQGLMCLKDSTDRFKKQGYCRIFTIDVVFRIIYPIAYIIYLVVFFIKINRLYAMYENLPSDRTVFPGDVF